MFIINKDNIHNPEILLKIFHFCHFLKIIVNNRIILFGSIVRDWLIPCYYYDLNPFRVESFNSLLDETGEELYIPEQVDIWLKSTNSWLNRDLDEMVHKFKNSGYNVTTTDKITQNEYEIQMIYLEALFGKNHNFLVKVYETSKFLSVDFDVNNLMFKCDKEYGLSTISLLSKSSLNNNIGFGFARSKSYMITDIIKNIISKKSLLLIKVELNDKMTRNYFLQRVEKIYEKNFTIINYTNFETTNTDLVECCSICQNEKLEVESINIKLKCTHQFHMNCLFKYWVLSGNSNSDSQVKCPNCRANYSLW